MWEQAIIEMQINREHILWIGDLNVKVGNDAQGIKGSHSDITYGGKMLQNIVKKRDMQLINATEKCGGLWTRINTGNKDQKSILDYVIASRKLEKKIKEMQIDEDGLYIPTRYKAETIVETDHRPIVIKIERDQQEEEDNEKDKDTLEWNFRKETEVNKYKAETEASEELSRMWSKNSDIQEQYYQWENNLEKNIGQYVYIQEKKTACQWRDERSMTKDETSESKEKNREEIIEGLESVII